LTEKKILKKLINDGIVWYNTLISVKARWKDMAQLDAIMAYIIQLQEELAAAKTFEECQVITTRLARWLELYKEQEDSY